MAKIPEGVDLQQLTIVARRVLLDGLFALNGQLDALTVVGGQAVYLRTPNAVMSGASFTADGDISVDPKLLSDQPLLEEALKEAGFSLMAENQPGLWARPEMIGDKVFDVELDLLIPKTLAITGKRSVRIPPHGKMSTRWVEGLEAAMVDRSPMVISSLESQDDRSIAVNVAGPAALMIAKAFKIRDRLNQSATHPGRLSDKDAGDVLRIMMAVPVNQVATSFSMLINDSRVGAISREGANLLGSLFGGSATPGVNMAVAALSGDISEDRIRALSPAFINGLRL